MTLYPLESRYELGIEIQSYYLNLKDAGFLEEFLGRNEICLFCIFIEMKITVFGSIFFGKDALSEK